MAQSRSRRRAAPSRYIESTPACWQWPALRIAGRIVGETCAIAISRQLQAMDHWQAGRCAICGQQFRLSRPYELVLDHDHLTNLTRGLLCNPCNMAEGRSHRAIFQAYRRRYPAMILGLTLPYGGGCGDASCDCYGRIRKDWMTRVIESGITDPDQVGTLQDLLMTEGRFATCVSVGGTRCCQHGPWTLPPPGRERCPDCFGWGFSSTGPDDCAHCAGEGHIALAPAVVAERLNAAVRDLEAVLGKPTWGVDASFRNDEEACAADLAARLLQQAATVLRRAET